MRSEIEIRVTPADVAALRRARQHARMSDVDYLRFLAQFNPTYDQLRAKQGPRGDAFRL